MTEIRPRETIIYGGAFNPPTRAHQAILQGCIDYAEPRDADVWLLPSASRRDKTIDVDRAYRIALCTALVQDCLRRTVTVDVSTRELDRDKVTETYDTVRELADTYTDRTFTWVFGSDSVATMREWSHGEWLFDNLAMLVVDRPGTESIEIGARAMRLSVRQVDTSSTELRARLAAGAAYDDLVSPAVGKLLVT